jgi:hypothetical protein
MNDGHAGCWVVAEVSCNTVCAQLAGAGKACEEFHDKAVQDVAV